MALLRVYQKIENDVYKLTFVNDPLQLSEADKKKMQQYGEPEIDLGGTFLADTELEYDLPSKLAKIRSDFPYTQEFDSRSEPFDTDTQTKVEGYRDQIVGLFTDAITTLREIPDTFTGEKTYNV